MWMSPIFFDGFLWPSREHCYQAKKLELVSGIPLKEAHHSLASRNVPTGYEAKRKTNAILGVLLPDSWKEIRVALMYNILLTAAFSDYHFIQGLLDDRVSHFQHTTPHPRPSDFWSGARNMFGQTLDSLRRHVISFATYLLEYRARPYTVRDLPYIYTGDYINHATLPPHLRFLTLGNFPPPPNIAPMGTSSKGKGKRSAPKQPRSPLPSTSAATRSRSPPPGDDDWPVYEDSANPWFTDGAADSAPKQRDPRTPVSPTQSISTPSTAPLSPSGRPSPTIVNPLSPATTTTDAEVDIISYTPSPLTTIQPSMPTTESRISLPPTSPARSIPSPSGSPTPTHFSPLPFPLLDLSLQTPSRPSDASRSNTTTTTPSPPPSSNLIMVCLPRHDAHLLEVLPKAHTLIIGDTNLRHLKYSLDPSRLTQAVSIGGGRLTELEEALKTLKPCDHIRRVIIFFGHVDLAQEKPNASRKRGAGLFRQGLEALANATGELPRLFPKAHVDFLCPTPHPSTYKPNNLDTLKAKLKISAQRLGEHASYIVVPTNIDHFREPPNMRSHFSPSGVAFVSSFLQPYLN